MPNFEDLVCCIKETEDNNTSLCNFLCKDNYKNYEIQDDLNKYQKKALKTMFNSNKDILDRVDEALEDDPFCIEAFFVYLMNGEDTFIYLRFKSYYQQACDYGEFDNHEKRSFIRIMRFYVDFLLDINNITSAIKVQKLIIKLTNDIETYISDLFDMYFTLEDEKELYKLYCECELNEKQYILLIITELKHDNEDKARDILIDMFDKYEYASYLDHVWDLNDDDENEDKFYKIVDRCFDDICSVPNFFSFVNAVREKYCK